PVVDPLAEVSPDTSTAELTGHHGTLCVSHYALPVFVTLNTATTAVHTLSLHDALPIAVLTSLTFTAADYEGTATLNVEVTSKDGDRTSSTLASGHAEITYNPFGEAPTAAAPQTATVN